MTASRTSGDYLKDVGWILDKILNGSYKRFLHLGNQVGLIELPLIMRNKLEEAAFFGLSEKQEEVLKESISLLCSNLKVMFMKTLASIMFGQHSHILYSQYQHGSHFIILPQEPEDGELIVDSI